MPAFDEVVWTLEHAPIAIGRTDVEVDLLALAESKVAYLDIVSDNPTAHLNRRVIAG